MMIPSWRDWAKTVPSGAQITPSSSNKPSYSRRVSNTLRHNAAGSQEHWEMSWRKWIVRSIVGLIAGESRAMKDGGNQASANKAKAGASTGRGSGRPIQPPIFIGAPLPQKGAAPLVGWGKVGHRQFVSAGRPPRNRESGECQRGDAPALLHARGECGERASFALHGHEDLDRSGLGRAGI